MTLPLPPTLRRAASLNNTLGKTLNETEIIPPRAKQIDEVDTAPKRRPAEGPAPEKLKSPIPSPRAQAVASQKVPKAPVASPAPADQSMTIDLNIGGKVFRTTRDTLSQDSTGPLGQLAESLSEKDVYIDRDPRHFHVILNFLRGTPFVETGRSVVELTEIMAEASFFGIHAIAERAESQIKVMSKPKDKLQYDHVEVRSDSYGRLSLHNPAAHGMDSGSNVSISDLSKNGWEPYWGNKKSFTFRRVKSE
jgi:hypothetical protein